MIEFEWETKLIIIRHVNQLRIEKGMKFDTRNWMKSNRVSGDECYLLLK